MIGIKLFSYENECDELKKCFLLSKINIEIKFFIVLFGIMMLCLFAVLQKWNIGQLRRLALRSRKLKVGQVL